MNKIDIRTIFLQEFIKRLIINSLPKQPQVGRRDGILEKLEKVSGSPRLGIKRKPEEIPPQLLNEILPMIEAKPEEKPAEKPIERPKVIPLPAAKPIAPAMIASLQIPVFDRLKPYITDPSVQSINCQGPDKNIILTRFGMPQTVSLAFRADEITSFLKDMSDRTKIPLLPGVFKIAYQNFILTAIVSEFIGTKFLIEKRTQIPLPLPLMQTAGQQRIQPVRATFK